MQVNPQPSMLYRFIRWCFRCALLFTALIVFLASCTVVGLLYIRSQPLPPYQTPETTFVYASDGAIIDYFHEGQNRTFVQLDEMPIDLIHAFLAVEDRRFYQHFGFDFRRIGGAVLANVRDGGFAEGASTVTQQLARNLYLNHEKTWERKLREALHTVQLEIHLSKDEILEQYLNQIYFGHAAYGVQAASRQFLDKSVQDLTLAESALIAGIPKGPAFYSPWINEERAFERQQLILDIMYEHGYISQAQWENASSESISIVNPDAERTANGSYFRDYVRLLAVEEHGITEEQFAQGGLHIYTTLDPELQEHAQHTMHDYLNNDPDNELQGALLTVDPRNGHILAMVGGRDYGESPFNRVFASRQPGSSFKPFLYYAALEKGLTPLTLMKSEPTTFTFDNGRQTYEPRNFHDSYANDYITLEEAVASSDNIYAVKTLMFLGKETFVSALRQFGFNRSFEAYPSIALGAQNVTLFEMVQAYSAFANQGQLTPLTAITHIKDNEGETLVEVETQPTQVLKEPETFILNHLLESVFDEGGTAYRVADQFERPISGKTGSTDWDGWMIGYTPQLVSGVWVGYDDNQLIHHNNEARRATDIWADFMSAALENQVPALFPVPHGVTGSYINPESGLLATEHCPVQKLVYFRSGTEPQKYCTDHLPDPDAEPTPVEVSPEEKQNGMWERLKEWWHDDSEQVPG